LVGFATEELAGRRGEGTSESNVELVLFSRFEKVNAPHACSLPDSWWRVAGALSARLTGSQSVRADVIDGEWEQRALEKASILTRTTSAV
jgi:hypothetical protein